MKEENKCKNCGSIVPLDRKFCNMSCTTTYNNKKYPKRTHGRIKPKCKFCNKQLDDHRRKYCSNKCQSSYKAQQRFKLVENGEFDKMGLKSTIDSLTKRYLIHIYGNKCMKCGWDKINKWTVRVPIEMNHIDGNPEHHELTNVELLCPNCYSLSEFTKSRGKGRKWRKTIFTA